MKKKSIYLLSAMILTVFVVGGSLHSEASVNSLTLTSPNGGEEISGGSTYEIEWVAPPEMASFKLICSMNKGRAWEPIKSGITATSYDWTVPKPKNNKPRCLVKVIGYDNTGKKVGADRSDAPFTILGKMESLEARVTALEEALELVLKLAPYVSVDTGYINHVAGPHVIFTGVNVHVRNGTGGTTVKNGLGNLIIGYNEVPVGIDPGERGGSYNLIIGPYHRFSNKVGLVAGASNTISGVNSCVSGGAGNTASGTGSTVSGGDYNTASGNYSSVSGGYNNEASGRYSSISGGRYNTVSAYYSSVSGGYNNEANADYSSISGGSYNTASGGYSSVSGGYNNEASGDSSSISGGDYNTASGNIASVNGGHYNTASGFAATVSGGLTRTAPGMYDWAAGSLLENQ